MAINPKIKERAEKIRKEVYGKDVREALASGLEVMSEDVEETKQRQDNVESQFQAVLDETTGKDVISAPEITAARVGADDTNYPNLKERLDAEYQKLSSQLAQTALIPQRIQGELDWTNAINRAIAKAKETGMKRIYFPAGTYEFGGIEIVDCPDLIIDGHKNATLKLIDSALKDCIKTTRSNGVRIRNISIEGNLQPGDQNITPIHGINFNDSKNCVVENVIVRRVKGVGFRLGSVNFAVNCIANSTGGIGFEIGADSHITNCQAGVTGGHGFYFAGSHSTGTNLYTWMTGNLYETMSIQNNPDVDGVRITGNNVVVSGFNVFAANRHGLYIGNCSGAICTGTVDKCGRHNHFDNNSGVYLENTKGANITVAVNNTGSKGTPESDEGWTKTGVFIVNPRLGSIDNVINVTTSNVDVDVDSNDIPNIELNNLIVPLLFKEHKNKNIRCFTSKSSIDLEHATPHFASDLDYTNGFTVSGEHIVVPETGIYTIYYECEIPESTKEGLKSVSLYLNSDIINSDSPTTTSRLKVTYSRTLRLIKGHTIRLRFFQNTGETLPIDYILEINYMHKTQ